jgi:hypothetical protein
MHMVELYWYNSNSPDNLCPAIGEEDPVLPGDHAAVTVLVLTVVEALVWVSNSPPIVVGHPGASLRSGFIGDSGGSRGLLGVVGEPVGGEEEEGEGEEEGLE